MGANDLQSYEYLKGRASDAITRADELSADPRFLVAEEVVRTRAAFYVIGAMLALELQSIASGDALPVTKEYEAELDAILLAGGPN